MRAWYSEADRFRRTPSAASEEIPLRALVTIVVSIGVSVGGIGGGAAPAAAHGTFHSRIEKVNDQLAEEPTNVVLLLRRAALSLDHGAHRDALADCAVVLRLEPGRLEAERIRGEAFLAVGRPDAALAAAAAWSRVDGGPGPHRLRARALVDLDRFAEAADALSFVLANDPAAGPGDALGLARLHLEADPRAVDAAVAVLDAGIARWRNPPALILEAVGVLRAAGRFEAAAARARTLSTGTAATLSLLGDIHREAGRDTDAMVLYTDALDALAERSRAGKISAADARLRDHLTNQLAGLNAALTEPSDDGKGGVE